MQVIYSSGLPKLPKRAIDAHKSAAGSVCVIAGSYGMAGAAALTAGAALAAGAGYVKVACPAEIYPILAQLVPSAVFLPFPAGSGGDTAAGASDSIERVLSLARTCNACVIGPGLGESPIASALVRGIAAKYDGPMVIDASALNVMGKETDLECCKVGSRVLTPHSGEAAKLLGKSSQEIQADRYGAAEAIARRFGCVAVLKGARTLVTDGRKLYENTSGNAGMAKAGTGDVLAGVIGAFAAQGLSAFDASCLGAYLHGKAGDVAARAKGRGLTATDLIADLPAAVVAYEGPFERGAGGVRGGAGG
jgi:NAD(P)H-hydrate epimerase